MIIFHRTLMYLFHIAPAAVQPKEAKVLINGGGAASKQLPKFDSSRSSANYDFIIC